MAQEYVNPILILAASTARSCHSSFAEELLNVDRGHRDCKAIRKSITRLAGLHDVSIARSVELSLLNTGSASLKRPHYQANYVVSEAQKEWATTQAWFVRADRTLSGNWIVCVTPRDGEEADLTLSTGQPVIQFGCWSALIEWASK